MPFVAPERFRTLVASTSLRQAASAGLFWAGVLLVCFIAGLLTIVAGDFGAQRPALLLAVPMLLILCFAYLLAPKTLVVAILLLRACAEPVFNEGRLPGIGGLGGMVNLVIIALAFALVVRDPKRVPREAWWIWLPFMFFQFVGLTYTPDLIPNLRLFLGQLATMSVFLLAFYLVHDWESFDRALKLIVASSVPVTVYTLVGIARGNTYMVIEGLEVSVSRYSGPFAHPNILAFYVVLVMGVLLYQWKSLRNKASTLKAFTIMGYLLVLLVVLFATKTRSAWVSAAFLFFIYGLLVERRFLLYLMLVPVFAMLVPEVRDRVLDLGQGNQVVQHARLNSFAWRKLIWTEGLAWMSKVRYLFGYGDGSFYYYAPVFFSLSGGRQMGAHSVVVQLFFEVGIGGVLAFLWMFWKSAKVILKAWLHDRLMSIVFGSLAMSYALIALSDNMLAYLTFNWYFWFAIGAVCAMVWQLPAAPVSTATSAPVSRYRSRYSAGLLR